MRWWCGVEEGSPGVVSGLLRNGGVGCEEQEQPWVIRHRQLMAINNSSLITSTSENWVKSAFSGKKGNKEQVYNARRSQTIL